VFEFYCDIGELLVVSG